MANLTLRRTNDRGSLTPSYSPSASRTEPFRWMEDLLGWDPFQEMFPMLRTSGAVFSPDFEVLENKDSYVFKADVPGIKESDVNISLSGNRLSVSGKREQEDIDKNDNYFAAERSYGAFSRSFTLPQGADVEHVRADLKDGVLSIYVPKHLESQPRKIEIGTTTPTTGGQGQKAHA